MNGPSEMFLESFVRSENCTWVESQAQTKSSQAAMSSRFETLKYLAPLPCYAGAGWLASRGNEIQLRFADLSKPPGELRPFERRLLQKVYSVDATSTRDWDNVGLIRNERKRVAKAGEDAKTFLSGITFRKDLVGLDAAESQKVIIDKREKADVILKTRGDALWKTYWTTGCYIFAFATLASLGTQAFSVYPRLLVPFTIVTCGHIVYLGLKEW